MSSTDDGNTLEACNFPPPSDIILSNLGNQLLLDEQFYIEVLNLAKQFGYSALYQRKAIVHPRLLNFPDRSPLSDLNSLAGHFLWTPYCPSETHKEEAFPVASSVHPKTHCVGKKIWSKRRKASYVQACPKTGIIKNPFGAANSKLGSVHRCVKINITNVKLSDLGRDDTKGRPIDTKDTSSSSSKDNEQRNVLLSTIRNNVQLCCIKPTEYDLFPIFKNYNEGKPGSKLYVKNLSKAVNVQDLITLFGEFVTSCKETTNQCFNVRFFERGKLRRQAFVTYPNTFMAAEACRDTNGIMIKGKPILVVFAHGTSNSSKKPAGKPIPLETLENKILAIDVSIWLNQAVKGFRDNEGGAIPNAHILGLFRRICKLLFYKIRPIFVFDGKAPELKRETLKRRRHKCSNEIKKSRIAGLKILDNFVKRQVVASQLQRQTLAVKKALEQGQDGLVQLIQTRAGKGQGGSNEKDLFELPPLPNENVGLNLTSNVEYSSDDDFEDDAKDNALAQLDVSDIHSLDVSSEHFQSLPTEVKFELLVEINGLRKQNSWYKMSEMPRNAEGFSGFQMGRLIKRNQVKNKLREVGKTLGEEAVYGLDASLFVGDKDGLRNSSKLKQEMKSVAFSGEGARMLYISGINEMEKRDSSDEGTYAAAKDDDIIDSTSSNLNKNIVGGHKGLVNNLEHFAGESEISQNDIYELIKINKNAALTKPEDSKKLTTKRKLTRSTDDKRQSSIDSESSSDNSSLDILEPTTQAKTSNRMGGKATNPIMTDVETPSTSGYLLRACTSEGSNPSAPFNRHYVDEKNVLSVEINIKPSQDEYMSTSGDSDEDIFADVFTEHNDIDQLDKILEGAQQTVQVVTSEKSIVNNDSIDEVEKPLIDEARGMTPRTLNQVSIMQSARELSEGNKLHDLYSQISKQSKTFDLNDTSFEVVDDCKSHNIVAEIANSMKNSDKVWLKKASKWAEERISKDLITKKSGLGKVTSADETSFENNMINAGSKANNECLVDWERKQLVSEMKQKEREDRLLKIKNISTSTTDLINKDCKTKSVQPQCNVQETETEVLSILGVNCVEQSEIEHQIMKNEGWISPENVEHTYNISSQSNDKNTTPKAKESSQRSDNEEIVYGDSVEGFVNTKKYNVIDSNKNDTTSNVDTVQGTSKQFLIEQETYEKLHRDDENDNQAEEYQLTEKELFTLQQKLAQEQELLVAERKKIERVAATLTDQMYDECQQLLQLFGIPWVVSPGEAEAQCAFLEESGLAHGIITDDSDVWVFGGKNVYKNFFDQAKYCESFAVNEVANHFGLTREKMILFAMLTGSDYTDGIENVGPVTAMEIIAEFPGEGINSLNKFYQWWKEMKESHNLGKGSMVPMTKVREKFKRLELPPNFPNNAVADAYMNPVVDTSTEKFTWAVPNFVAVRDYASEKFGWTKVKTDQVVKPVIRKMTSTGQKMAFQNRIDNFFQSERTVLPSKGNLQSSKRVKEAIDMVLKKDGFEEPNTQPVAVENDKCGDNKGSKIDKRKNKRTKSRVPGSNGKIPGDIKSSLDTKHHSDNLTVPQVCEKEKKEIAKQKAIEIYKKSRTVNKRGSSSTAKGNLKGAKSSNKSAQRKVLSKHNLSESDESD